ncbi:unnamed protein product [Moneuplotes crassus]|uniref:RING-type domain-containing protein n=1 Tax=Euplotes crassus TaxID=5936 RepID=A0AAD2CZM3_EUPCR|nr:unnamed protein product [Moneuplotes crassus]
MGGLSATSFIIVFHIIITYDYKYKDNYTAQERSKMSEEFTSVKLPWSKEFPVLLLSIFLLSLLIFTLLSYKLLIIWIERLFYPDNLNRVFMQNEEMDDLIDEEIEVKSYKFQAPGLIKKITSTYFIKSKKEDMERIKKKLSGLIKKYKRQESKCTVDLENMLRDRDFEVTRNRVGRAIEEAKVNNTTQMSNIVHTQEDLFSYDISQIVVDKKRKKNDKALHLSMASPKEIQKCYKKFVKENNLREVSNYSLSSKIESKTDKETYECCVCYTNPPNGVFFACGHAGICYECAVEIFKKKGKCHFCRKEVSLVLRIELKTVFDEYVLVKAATFNKFQKVKFDSEYSIESEMPSYNEERKSRDSHTMRNQEESKRLPVYHRSSVDESQRKPEHYNVSKDRQEISIRALSNQDLSVRRKEVSSKQSRCPYKNMVPSNTLRFRHSQRSMEFSKGGFTNRIASLRKTSNRKFEEIKDKELADHGLNQIPNQLDHEFLVKMSENNAGTFRNKFMSSNHSNKNSNVKMDKIQVMSELDEIGGEEL